MLLHKFELFCPNGFWEEVFQRFSLHFKVKIHPPLWSLPSPGDHDLPKLEYTLLEDDSQQIWDFLAQTFLRRLSKTFSIYSNVFKCILYIKSMWNLTPPPTPVAHPTYRDFKLKKLKPTLLGDGFFRQNIFEKEIFEKHQANSIIIIYLIFWKTWTFVFTNLNCLHLVMLCAEFGWNRQKKDDNVISLQRKQQRQQQRLRQTTEKSQLRWAKKKKLREGMRTRIKLDLVLEKDEREWERERE